MPSPAESNRLFGPLVAPWNVEQAVIATTEAWLPTYLAEVERKNGLSPRELGRPPAPESYRGGIDQDTMQAGWLPMVTVAAEPVGEPERSAQAYVQSYLVDVWCIVLSEEGSSPEETARRNAGLFAAAVMGALQGHGELGGFAAQETLLVGSPKTEAHPNFPERKDVMVGMTSWHVFAELLDPNSGPLVVKAIEPEEPYPAEPEAKTQHITVTGEPVQTAL